MSSGVELQTRMVALYGLRQPSQLGSIISQEVGQRARGSGFEQDLENLTEGLIGGARIDRGGSHEDRETIVVQYPGHLGCESSLSRAGLATDENDLAVAVLDRGPYPLNDFQLVSAADEWNSAGCRHTRGQCRG